MSNTLVTTRPSEDLLFIFFVAGNAEQLRPVIQKQADDFLKTLEMS
jgi:hypothetical protein